VSNQIVSDWQWEAMKKTAALRVAEKSHEEFLEIVGDVLSLFR